MSAIELETAQQGGAGGFAGGRIGEPAEAAPVSQRAEIWRRFRRNKLAMVGLAIIALLFLMAVFAPALTALESAIGGVENIDPEVGSRDARENPSSEHWFGTDQTGRDIFSRIVYGARISLLIGFSSVAISVTIGLVAGALAGHYGGAADTTIMRATDVALSLPYIILAIALVVLFGRSLTTIVLVLGLLGWMGIARIFRSSILQVKGQEFVEAARAIGCSNRRIVMRHLVPNSIQPVIVYGTLLVGTAILSEAALSFLNVGATEPTPSWGLMINGGRSFLRSSPHILFFPAIFLLFTIVAFTLVGDGLRDALDPKLKK